MIHQFREPIEVETPLGDGIALLLIDYGWMSNSCWVVVLKNGIVKHFDSNDIRVSPNFTWGVRRDDTNSVSK